jgi:hypothetical protein
MAGDLVDGIWIAGERGKLGEIASARSQFASSISSTALATTKPVNYSQIIHNSLL